MAGIVAQVYSSAIALNYGWRWIFWLLAIAYMIFILVIITQIPQIARQNVKISILNVYKNMAALLNRFSLLAVYLAGFTLLFSFVAMYSGLRAYLSLQYGVDQQRLLLIRIAGAPGILLSPVLNKIFQRYRLSIINLPINDKHYL